MKFYILEIEKSRNGKRQAHCFCPCGYAALFIEVDAAYGVGESHLNHKHKDDGGRVHLMDV